MNMSGTSVVVRQSCFGRTTNHLLHIADELSILCSLELLTGSVENVRALGFLLWREYPQVIFDFLFAKVSIHAKNLDGGIPK